MLLVQRSERVGSRISNAQEAFAEENPAPGCLHQPMSESRNVAPSHAVIGGTSGSSCGPGRDRSGEFPFSLFLMHISAEKSTTSDERFFD